MFILQYFKQTHLMLLIIRKSDNQSAEYKTVVKIPGYHNKKDLDSKPVTGNHNNLQLIQFTFSHTYYTTGQT